LNGSALPELQTCRGQLWCRRIAMTPASGGARGLAMAYIFHENELPSLISEVRGRERIFFVN
jgi:hypothetical protein